MHRSLQVLLQLFRWQLQLTVCDCGQFDTALPHSPPWHQGPIGCGGSACETTARHCALEPSLSVQGTTPETVKFTLPTSGVVPAAPTVSCVVWVGLAVAGGGGDEDEAPPAAAGVVETPVAGVAAPVAGDEEVVLVEGGGGSGDGGGGGEAAVVVAEMPSCESAQVVAPPVFVEKLE